MCESSLYKRRSEARLHVCNGFLTITLQGAGLKDKGKAHDGFSKEERATGRADMAELLEQYFQLDYEGKFVG